MPPDRQLSPASHVGSPLGHEIGIGTVADEADLLALRLLRHREIESASQGPRLGLVQPAQRKMKETELILRQGVEDVALVLSRIDRAQQAVRRPGLGSPRSTRT